MAIDDEVDVNYAMHDFSCRLMASFGHGVLIAPKQKDVEDRRERIWEKGTGVKLPKWGVSRLGTHRDLINETLVEILNLPITSQANWTKMSNDILAQVGLKASLYLIAPEPTHPEGGDCVWVGVGLDRGV